MFDRDILSLSVEGYSLRLLTVRGGSVRHWSSLPISPLLIRNGYVANPPALAQVIKEAIAAQGLSGRAVCSLPGLRSSTRVLSLPPLARGHLAAVVNREARRLMAFSPETSYLFWQALPSGPAQLQVFVMSVPREPLVNMVESVRLAGLKPRGVDVRPLALARAVNRERAIVASAELTSIEMVIVVDRLPQLMRGVSLGEDGNTAELAAARLVDELARTISFYNDTHREQPLGREVPVFLAGDVINPNLTSLVQEATGRQVLPLASPLRCPQELPVASFLVNLGLALKKL